MKTLTRSKSISFAALFALNTTTAYAANTQMPAEPTYVPPAGTQENSTNWKAIGHGAGGTVSGVVAAGSGYLSLQFFLEGSEFTPKQRLLFMNTQEFVKKAWVANGSYSVKNSISLVGERVDFLEGATVGAVRVTVGGMSEAAARDWLDDQYRGEADLINQQRAEIARSVSRGKLAEELETVLRNSDYPIAPVTRTMLIELVNKEVAGNGPLSPKEVEAVGRYLDSKHASFALKRTGRAYPRELNIKIETMKENMGLIFTGSKLESPQYIDEVIGGRKVIAIDFISAANYQKTLAEAHAIRMIPVTSKATHARMTRVGSILAIPAALLGGLTIDQYNRMVQAMMRKEWAPKPVEVK